MTDVPRIDISPANWEIVAGILRRHVPDREVWAFGSRARWTAKEYSDLDLAVLGDSPMGLSVVASLNDDFAGSDLSFKVDLVDWATTSEPFRKVIREQKVVVQERRSLGRVGDWREATLGDVIELKRGYDLPQRERVPGPVPLVSSSGVTDHHFEAKVKGPGVVTGRYGTLGQVFFVREDFWPLNTTLYVRDFKGNDPRFVSYFLTGLDYLAYSDKAAVPGLNRNHLHQATVRFPSNVAEQRAIAHILGTLDDKIELNRRMSETLEAMARALFKSWFIDFDPVRRNAARARNQPSPGAARHPLPGGEGHYRGGYDFTELVKTARALRKKQTPAEEIFWQLVRDRRFLGLTFRRQHQLGDYVADFYCHDYRLVVELDGGVHKAKREKDHKRDAWMEAQGFTVLRFSNEHLLDAPESVFAAITHVVADTALPPLPLGEGRGEGSGASEAYDRLFPDSFEDSELGEIPTGWEVGTLGDLSTVNPEVWSKQTRPFEINYVDLSNTKWGRIEAVTVHAATDAPSRAQRVLRPGDTIIGTVRPGNGSYALISEGGLTGSTGFAVLRPSKPQYAQFVYLAATAAENIDALAHLADGGAYPAVRPEVVAATPVVRPDDEALRRFSHASGPLLAKMAHNEREARTLAALRDTLLPRLISGALRVKDAERFLETSIT